LEGLSYDELRRIQQKERSSGMLVELQEMTKGIRAIRNAFDHAWTSKSEVEKGLREQGVRCHKNLCDFIIKLIEQHLLA